MDDHKINNWCFIVNSATETIDINIKPIEPTRKDSKNTHIEIEQIQECDIKSLTDIALLENASLIAKNLKFQFTKKYETNPSHFTVWLKSSLNWLNNVMLELKKRYTGASDKITGLIELSRPTESDILKPVTSSAKVTPSITSSIKSKRSIPRNSYKFCEYNFMCRFHYGSKKEGCYSQHFVYESVSQDIVNILNCLHAEIYELTEIKTSINTITYVINHMFDEMVNRNKNIN